VARVRDAAPRPRRVVLELSQSPRLDLPSVNMLGELEEQLRTMGGELRLAEVHGQAHERLLAEGVADRFGGVERRASVAALVAAAVAAPSDLA
jgi:MFS superfamily sulfate permease-like transporter